MAQAAPDHQPRPLLRIGLVPEHFSAPLQLAAADGTFAEHGVDVELVTCPGGTGEMLQLLERRELDLAIGLTEGLVKSIAGGNDGVRLVGTYVEAPLTWAVSAGAASRHTSVASLQYGAIGISRIGSGSHVMAVVMAEQAGWLPPAAGAAAEAPSSSSNSRSSSSSSDDNAGDAAVSRLPGVPLAFVTLNDFRGLRDGVNSGRADAFLWETFTTKPYHDSKELRRIGEIRAPWAAFMVAARADLLDMDAKAVQRLLAAVNVATARFSVGTATGASQAYVAKTFGQQPADVEAWFRTVRYPADAHVVSRPMLQTCLDSLRRARLVPDAVDIASLVDARVAIVTDLDISAA